MPRLVPTLFALAFAPALALAQGRLIERPCFVPTAPPPRCGPAEDCVAPRPSCGPQLERSSSVVRVALADRVLRFEVTEKFRNVSNRVAEADYIFPLPAGAAFEDLKLSINGELVAGETMSADRARGIYEEIVRRQRDPALVEWMGSGMLRTRIFPINPGEEKTVVVRYQSVATREGDALRIDYRQGSDPNASGAQLAARQRSERGDGPRAPTRIGDASARSSFTFLYQASRDFGEPYSPTHALRTREEGRLRAVEARGEGRELTILLPLRRADVASLSVLTHAPEGERGFALITVTPPSAARRTTPRDITFVVDVSGSMSGTKLEQAKAAGVALLETMRPDDRFRVIAFSTDVNEFRDGWTAATREGVREAHRYLDALSASGSTNISGALERALERRPSGAGRLPLVVFVTDGEPTVGERNPDAIAAIAARLRGEARLFSVGVSADVNAGLIEQLAVEGRGTAHFVRNSESVEQTVSLLARRLTSPVLTNVRVRTEGVRLSQLLPSGAVDVFAGQDLVLLARYEGDGTATLRLEGESADGPVTWTTRARFPERDRANPFVARLWAAQRVGWLAAEKRRGGGTNELDAEIKSLGEKYGIPTEFSSYLVVEPGMQLAGNAVAPTSRDRSMPVAGQQAMPNRKSVERRVAAADMAASAPAAPATANEMRFEAARASAAQRETKSIAALDSIGGATAATQRRVGARLLTLANGVWTDARYTATMRTVRVKPFSPLYFQLMQRIDALPPLFAVGDRLIVAGRSVAIELSSDGAESLGTRELDSLVRDW